MIKNIEINNQKDLNKFYKRLFIYRSFLYKKVTTDEVKRYEVIPTEYKYKKLRAGWRKVLYIQDVREKKQIKLFVVRNILKVALTDRKPKSMWPIKIV